MTHESAETKVHGYYVMLSRTRRRGPILLIEDLYKHSLSLQVTEMAQGDIRNVVSQAIDRYTMIMQNYFVNYADKTLTDIIPDSIKCGLVHIAYTETEQHTNTTPRTHTELYIYLILYANPNPTCF